MMDAIDENGDLKIMMGLCVQSIEESNISTPEARAAAAYICFLTRSGGVDDPALASLLSSCVDDTDWMDIADYVTAENPKEALRHRLAGDDAPPKMRTWDHPEYARWIKRRPPASISCSR